jgi:phosphoglycolate phosphatase-like HAD superfamily hydrolase
MKKSYFFTVVLFIFLAGCNAPETTQSAAAKDPLPSWNQADSKQAILDFVNRVTDENSPDFIPTEERIATFDNDGTLWSEQPMYFQLFFVMDRVKEMARDHPEWDTLAPFSYALKNDLEGIAQSGMQGLMQLVMTTHTGSTQEAFAREVRQWADTAVHPTKKVAYTKLVYQPMLELLDFLKANGFKNYIVSGGGVDFMRPLVQEVYGIPAEQIIGSTIKTRFNYNNGNPQIERLPELFFIDDKEGKPENIQRIIGRKPILAAGNSDGDLAMLQYTASNKNYLNIYVHHTDAEREWAYDRESHIGKLDKGLDQAKAEGWTVVDMKNDWKVIWPE